MNFTKPPQSDAEMLEYQKEYCNKCTHQIDLVRGKFKKGCDILDWGKVQSIDQMFKADGHCWFFNAVFIKGKQNWFKK